MLTIYTDKHCEKVAQAIASGASNVEHKITKIPEFTEQNVLCIAKKPFGNELKQIADKLIGAVYVVGVGFSFDKMRKMIEELQKDQPSIKVEVTLCLKRKGTLPLGGEVTEIELARVSALGERIATTITGTRQRPQNEKNRIQNYNK